MQWLQSVKSKLSRKSKKSRLKSHLSLSNKHLKSIKLRLKVLAFVPYAKSHSTTWATAKDTSPKSTTRQSRRVLKQSQRNKKSLPASNVLSHSRLYLTSVNTLREITHWRSTEPKKSLKKDKRLQDQSQMAKTVRSPRLQLMVKLK